MEVQLHEGTCDLCHEHRTIRLDDHVYVCRECVPDPKPAVVPDERRPNAPVCSHPVEHVLMDGNAGRVFLDCQLCEWGTSVHVTELIRIAPSEWRVQVARAGDGRACILEWNADYTTARCEDCRTLGITSAAEHVEVCPEAYR